MAEFSWRRLLLARASVVFTVLDMTPKRASLDLDFGPKVETVPGAVCKRRNRPPPGVDKIRCALGPFLSYERLL
jgi:hypothetical protein